MASGQCLVWTMACAKIWTLSRVNLGTKGHKRWRLLFHRSLRGPRSASWARISPHMVHLVSSIKRSGSRILSRQRDKLLSWWKRGLISKDLKIIRFISQLVLLGIPSRRFQAYILLAGYNLYPRACLCCPRSISAKIQLQVAIHSLSERRSTPSEQFHRKRFSPHLSSLIRWITCQSWWSVTWLLKLSQHRRPTFNKRLLLRMLL